MVLLPSENLTMSEDIFVYGDGWDTTYGDGWDRVCYWHLVSGGTLLTILQCA